MNVISKQHLEDLLDGFNKEFKTAEYGSIAYWQNKGAVNLLTSMLLIYYP